MRITVLRRAFVSGFWNDTEEVLADFPYLTKEDILACLAYAADREKRILVKQQ